MSFIWTVLTFYVTSISIDIPPELKLYIPTHIVVSSLLYHTFYTFCQRAGMKGRGGGGLLGKRRRGR